MSQVVPLPIVPPPGLVATESQRAAEGRWVLPWNWMRFVRGRPQKIGGYILGFVTATSGIAHSLLAWTDLNVNRFLAAGTYRKLYVYDTNGVQNDITPFRLTGSLTNPFTTTISSSVVSVAHTGHGLSAGDVIIFTSVASAVGGITALQLTGTFAVNTVTDANNYTFDCGVTASSSAGPGGGAVNYQYEIPVGTEQGAAGLGWGVGGWGLGTWGTARSSSTVTFEPRVWSQDHFGKILLSTYNGGSMYSFDPTTSQPWSRAAVIAAAPTDCRALIVTPERYVFALRENLVMASCTQGDYTTWTPATSNTAFTRTLTEGTKLISGRVLAPFQTLIWSDFAVYLFQWTGDTYVYRSSLMARDCGLVGPQAACTVGGVAYWMGPSNFFMYSGGAVIPMPNVEDIRKYVYDNFTTGQGFEVGAWYNPIQHEIWFNVPMFSATTPNRLIIFHINDQCWTIHTSNAAAGAHFPTGDNRPYVADTNGFIYQYENGNDAAGSAITSQWSLAPFAAEEGLNHVDLEGILLDLKDQAGAVSVTVNTYDRLTDTVVEDTETESVADSQAGLTDFRTSGRYLSLLMSQSSLGAYCRWGKPVAFVKTSGRRR